MQSLKGYRKRHKRCYELAAMAMVREGHEKGLRLMHGKWWSGRMWIEPRPAAVTDHVYTHAQSCRLFSVTEHSGPWTEDDRKRANKREEELG